MLINKNFFDKNKSKYCCDRCKSEMLLNNRYSIYIGLGSRTAHKRWDLCIRCYKLLEKGIEKK